MNSKPVVDRGATAAAMTSSDDGFGGSLGQPLLLAHAARRIRLPFSF
jgi:hypothetical protein